MKSFSLVVSGFILSIAVSLVHSFDLHFLKHSPARHFTKQDWEIAKTATRDILDNHSQGESVTWDNPDSGNSGALKITKAGTSSGRLCKRLQITNRAKGQEHTSSYVFCRQPDGTWKTMLKK
ncbi:MAG: RT0821/Lpp0805 family surface protein [Candidatus Thiodiazotropha sp.]